jgi:WD40 repeat protein
METAMETVMETAMETVEASDQQQAVAPVAVAPLVAARSAPRRVFHARGEFCATAATTNNFTKGVHASPDGLCLLSTSDDRVLRVFEVAGAAGEKEEGEDARSVLQMREGGTVYDAAWYPFMTSQDPGTCIFISTSRDQPVHMWDAYTGGVSACRRRPARWHAR